MDVLYIRAINDMRMCNSFCGFFASFTQTAVSIAPTCLHVCACVCVCVCVLYNKQILCGRMKAKQRYIRHIELLSARLFYDNE